MKGFFLPVALVALGFYLWPESKESKKPTAQTPALDRKAQPLKNEEKRSSSSKTRLSDLKLPTRPEARKDNADIHSTSKVQDAMTLIERLANEWRKIADNHYRYDLQIPNETLEELHAINEEFTNSMPFEFEQESEEEIRRIVTEYYESHERRYRDALKTLLKPDEFSSIEERRQSYNQWISKAYPQLQGFEVTYY